MIGRILGLLSIPLTIIMLVSLARQLKKNQQMSVGSSFVAILMSSAILTINLVFTFQSMSQCVLLPLLFLGLVLGLAWGQTTRLAISHGAVVGRQSILHLVFWAISVTAN